MEWITPPKPRRDENALRQNAGSASHGRDFDREIAEFQVRVAAQNGYTALGIPVTKVVG